MSGSDYKYDPDDSSYANYYSNSWYAYDWSYWNLW
jgi:hypothetical protein